MTSAMLWSIRSTRTTLVANGAEHVCKLGDFDLGKAGCWLVHEHEARLDGERTGDLELPFLAVRKYRCRRVCVRSDTEEVEELRRPATSISGSSADSQSGYLDVLTHGEVSEGVAVLERARETGAPPAVRPPARDVAILELDGARARKVEARHDVHERRLAGAVRPDEPDHLTAAKLERDALERMNAHEGPRDTGGPERASGHRFASGVAACVNRGQPVASFFVFQNLRNFALLLFTNITRYTRPVTP